LCIFEGKVIFFVVDDKVFEEDEGQGFEAIVGDKFLLPEPGEEGEDC
jgi:hypothetical protein